MSAIVISAGGGAGGANVQGADEPRRVNVVRSARSVDRRTDGRRRKNEPADWRRLGAARDVITDVITGRVIDLASISSRRPTASRVALMAPSAARIALPRYNSHRSSCELAGWQSYRVGQKVSCCTVIDISKASLTIVLTLNIL